MVITDDVLPAQFAVILAHLDGRQRRLTVGAEARMLVMAGSDWWRGPRVGNGMVARAGGVLGMRCPATRANSCVPLTVRNAELPRTWPIAAP
jgi:hypothetical protein